MRRRYYRRRWDERRGDERATWGPATYWFEVGATRDPERQVEQYDGGQQLVYGPDHLEDEHGMLAAGRPDETEDWDPWEVSHEEFETAWREAIGHDQARASRSGRSATERP